MITAKAKLAGVIGCPVTHSLSPCLHNFWLKQYNIDGAYIPLPVRPDDLKDVLSSLIKMGFLGANITLPHKESVLPFLDYIDEVAVAIGAVNTISIKDEKLFGTNTDAYGFWKNIESILKFRNKAVVLGAGGAARAVCYALVKNGLSEIIILNRTPEKAEGLSKVYKGKITQGKWQDRSAHLANADLLINTTSLGMMGKDELEIDLRPLPITALVNDIVYVPLITPLLSQAKARGNPIADGLGMLLHQAVPAFEGWFGVHPKVDDVLRSYVLSAP